MNESADGRLASGSGEGLEPGLFSKRLTEPSFDDRPCLFLDRDGVIVEETNYLHRVGDVAFIDGVAEAVARANRMAIPVVMVTNQAGIGRGLYGWDDFDTVQRHIYQRFARDGAHFDMVVACAYHAEGIGDYGFADHPWRKPAPGMIDEVRRVLGVDLARSFIVGDTLSDLRAGKAAGLPAAALVTTGHGEREWREHGERAFADWLTGGSFEVKRFPGASEAIRAWLDGEFASSPG